MPSRKPPEVHVAFDPDALTVPSQYVLEGLGSYLVAATVGGPARGDGPALGPIRFRRLLSSDAELTAADEQAVLRLLLDHTANSFLNRERTVRLKGIVRQEVARTVPLDSESRTLWQLAATLRNQAAELSDLLREALEELVREHDRLLRVVARLEARAATPHERMVEAAMRFLRERWWNRGEHLLAGAHLDEFLLRAASWVEVRHDARPSRSGRRLPPLLKAVKVKLRPVWSDRFEPAGPGRAIRPARIITHEEAKALAESGPEVVWHWPKVIPPDVMRLLVELELELFGRGSPPTETEGESDAG